MLDRAVLIDQRKFEEYGTEVPAALVEKGGGMVQTLTGLRVPITLTTGKDVAPTPGRDSETTPQPSQSAAAQETYIGNLNSKVFHREDCSNLPAEQNRVLFSSREEAVNEGYSPCGNCKP